MEDLYKLDISSPAVGAPAASSSVIIAEQQEESFLCLKSIIDLKLITLWLHKQTNDIKV